MSEIDADHGRRRSRSNVLAVVLAVVFLTILGASVGVILGTQRGGDDDRNNAGSGSSASASPDVTVTETTTPTADPGGTKTRTGSPSATRSYRPPTRDDCPQQTDEGAGTELTVKLYIRTRSSEVWICQGGGRTFYQGHLRGQPFPSATSNHSLFIPNPRYEAGVWAATNGSTVYYVSRERLRREKNGVEESNEAVEEYYEG